MADVNISKYRASVVRDGSKPASPGFVVSEGQDPVNPPGTNNYVPYTGATANVELGEFGLETGFVTLDTTPTNVPTEQGAIYWDDSRSTAALIMNGTLQHIGQDTFFYVKNSSAYTIPKGTCVRFAGTDGASGHLLILPFTANGAFPSSYFMGVTAEDIANGEFGQVMHFGELTGIDTTGYTAGALLYASSTVAGAFQTTAPLAPNNIVLVAAAVNSKVNGSIVVRPTLGSNFGTNESVKLNSVTDKDLLQFQSGTGLWENKTVAQVLGGNPITGSGTLNFVPKFTSNLGTIGNSSIQDNGSNITLGLETIVIGNITASNLSGTNTGNVTIGTANGLSLSGQILSLGLSSSSSNGALSSTDWTTFNNKQNALTNPVTGTGTTNYLPKFTGNTTIGNSALQETNGNLGLGVTPTAWDSGWLGGNTNALEIGQLGSSIAAGAGGLLIGNNYIFNSGTNKYARSFPATYYIQNTAAGQHQWWLAPSGTAGNTITFTQAMTLTNGGNLLVGTTTDNGARLQVSGTSTFSDTITIRKSITTGAFGPNATTINLINTSTSETTAGNIQFTGFSGNSVSPYQWGLISGEKDTNAGDGNYAGSLTFWTTSGGANGEANSGIYKRVTIKGSGNVGIGTSSPATRLMVQDTANTYVAHFSGLNQANGIAIGTNSSNVAVIQGYTRTFSATNNISMQADGGNVGIGTFSPSAFLHIVTPTGVNFQNAIRFEKAGGFGEVNLENYYTSGSNYGFGIDVAGTTMMVVNNLGSVGIGTTNPSFQLHVNKAGNTGIFLSNTTGNAAGYLYAGGLDGLEIQSVDSSNSTAKKLMLEPYGGNVLIGTTTDNGAKLNVNGTIRTSNPTGSTSDGWLLGRALVSGTSTPDRWIRVQIGNLYYDILAVYMGSV